MRVFFYNLWRNLLACFSWPLIPVHLLAIALTYAAVVSGFDWRWYAAGQGVPRAWVMPGILLGGLLPIVMPFVALAAARLRKDEWLRRAAGALAQSAFLGWLISSSCKALTGRAHPTFGTALTDDVTGHFQFGFLRAGIFWGWPSSHTTVAFATMVALAVLYREKSSVKIPALLYALYVGLAVSVSIHWFSDFLAGALIGTSIGLAVGRSFRDRAVSPS